LQPSNFLTFEQASKSKKKRNPYWGYNGFGENGFQLEWHSLNHGFDFILQILNSKKSDIVNLALEFDPIWWCGHFQTGFDGGFTLSPNLLNSLGSYNIPLFVDNYFEIED
jgi:hypothetical protein